MNKEILSVPALASQWMEGSSHPSPENVATALLHIVKRLIPNLMSGFYHAIEIKVIYVKPGYESNLDPLIQDTIRLTTSVKDTCLESCDRSEPTLQFPTEIVGRNVASIYKRWSRLLELKQKSLPL
ncbi:hypothetical protein GH714_038970 [Hevea brasiliensis]|uniref:Uncharacterized protein n=1 Tax=Hevea brasiliensis TaxID=3981 RepID=A0A6A6LQ73_HEVBR|nr:hypothetical protein GH714_038970 [Hevea brasiliensis]